MVLARIVPAIAFSWWMVTAPCLAAESPVSGELRKWHRVSVTVDGPRAAERGTPNPFRDFRLVVTFEHPASKTVHTVPGFFAADGRAAETGAEQGNRWRAHFTPDQEGDWTWRAALRSGKDVALSADPEAGQPVELGTARGQFQIAATDKQVPDSRARGMLRPVGHRYLRWAQTGEWFLKGGANSPENLLAYVDFDGTPPKHRYREHETDWREGDPTWGNGKGKGIIGAMNYLAAAGVNAQYFLTMNVNGDGDDVWPWIDRDSRDRFDCSKLDQWEIVFGHMTARGLLLHVVFNEQECDQLLNDGELGPERRLYYRELVARFGHHPAVTWNIGEESTNTPAQRDAYIDYLRSIDPYGHPIVVHTFPGHYDRVYDALLANPRFTGPALQLGDPTYAHDETIKWLDRSTARGRPWWVCLDEIGPARDGLVPDSVDPAHDTVRHRALWGNLLAGGGGVEWYFGWGHHNHDRALEDFRTREKMWRQTDHALGFFRRHLPFDRMTHNDGLTRSPDDYCFADPGRVYAIYLPSGGETVINLGSSEEAFTVDWFDPRNGGDLRPARPIRGPGWQTIGPPPVDPQKDWVLLVRESRPADITGPGRITGFSLIDCDTNQPVPGFDPIPPDAVLDMGRLPKRLAVRVNTEPGQVGCVVFGTDKRADDSTAPFAFPRDVNGRYEPWKLAAGRHEIRVTPFSQGAGDGVAGETRTLSFEIKNP